MELVVMQVKLTKDKALAVSVVVSCKGQVHGKVSGRVLSSRGRQTRHRISGAKSHDPTESFPFGGDLCCIRAGDWRSSS